MASGISYVDIWRRCHRWWKLPVAEWIDRHFPRLCRAWLIAWAFGYASLWQARDLQCMADPNDWQGWCGKCMRTGRKPGHPPNPENWRGGRDE